MSISEATLAAMSETNDKFDLQVVQTKNVEALDEIYTRDARILPPGAQMIEGRENIKSFWREALKALGATSAQLKTVSAEMSGDNVVEIGKATLKTSSHQQISIKYVVFWKQEDGHWKWHFDIWNTNE